MAVQLNISYETLVHLVDQLPDEQKNSLLKHLSTSTENALTAEEKLALYRASILHHPVNEAPSIRRIDWYDDDGR